MHIAFRGSMARALSTPSDLPSYSPENRIDIKGCEMRNRRRKPVRHQARVGYLDKGPLCQCGRWHCPDLGRELDREFDRNQRMINVGQLIVLLLSMITLLVCCVGGALWLG